MLFTVNRVGTNMSSSAPVVASCSWYRMNITPAVDPPALSSAQGEGLLNFIYDKNRIQLDKHKK